MTTYGSSNDYISISTAIAGSPSGPSGDIVYLFASKLRGRVKFGQKITELPLGNSYSNKTGKYGNEITLTDVVLLNPISNGGSDNTDYFNKVKNLLSSWQLSAHNPIYMIANSDADSGRNIDLSFVPTTGDTRDYIKGYITDIDWEPESNVFYIKSLTFKECLT